MYRSLRVPPDGKTRIQMERLFAKEFDTEEINFKTRMLVLVVAGAVPSGGYQVRVTRVQHDRGTEALVRDLRRLAHANMEEEIERFTSALHAGHIQPEDF